MPFHWAPAPVTVALYRVTHGNWQPLGDTLEMAALSDEELYKQCR